MKFPRDPDTPVIMVGPGTGVAPFRSALQERASQGKTGEWPREECCLVNTKKYCRHFDAITAHRVAEHVI